MPGHKKDDGVIYHFEDLPKEWQDIAFLRQQIRQSVKLTGLFTAMAGVGWVNHYNKVAEIQIDPAAGQHQEAPAIGITALFPTVLALVGTIATIRLKLLLREGEKKRAATLNKPDGPSGP